MVPRAIPGLVLALAAAALGCGGSRGGGTLRAADPAQALDAVAENEAQADVGGVAVRAAIGGWRGDPRDLEQKLTPVDVTVRNGSGRPIHLGPEAFWLVVGDRRLRVLDQGAVSRAMTELVGSRRYGPRAPRVGAVGGPTFPGYDGTDPYGPRSDSPANAPVPAAGSWYPSQLPSGMLAAGAATSVILYFDTPGRTLRKAALEVNVLAADGERIGTIRMPYERDD